MGNKPRVCITSLCSTHFRPEARFPKVIAAHFKCCLICTVSKTSAAPTSPLAWPCLAIYSSWQFYWTANFFSFLFFQVSLEITYHAMTALDHTKIYFKNFHLGFKLDYYGNATGYERQTYVSWTWVKAKMTSRKKEKCTKWINISNSLQTFLSVKLQIWL